MKTALIAIAILSRLPCRRLRDDRNGNLNIATYLQGYCREDGYVAILQHLALLVSNSTAVDDLTIIVQPLRAQVVKFTRPGCGSRLAEVSGILRDQSQITHCYGLPRKCYKEEQHYREQCFKRVNGASS
ncbi:hypothetical protein Y032_0021g398 [Ancylostoma ceylanicum]|uniref:Uncharacterized protein n=1 Tax=Ancylostoma ceylanicum TaxID=53326 RepID=A0A016V149_9BILA|nr:hypothetical protein Y032_0021g398 [Ancylostoma ceylanicum]